MKNQDRNVFPIENAGLGGQGLTKREFVAALILGHMIAPFLKEDMRRGWSDATLNNALAYADALLEATDPAKR